MAALIGIAMVWLAVMAPFFWCCCGPATCSTTVSGTVSGCGNVLASRTVRLKVAGSTVATATTNGSGFYTISYVSTYPLDATVEIDAECGYAAGSTNVTLNCSPITANIGVNEDTNHYCCNNCSTPIPKTLYFTCASGTATLTMASPGAWTGTLTFTGKGADPLDAGQTYSCCSGAFSDFKFLTSTQSISFPITYSCGGAGVGFLRADWSAWYGITDCTTCDWGYNVSGGGTPYGTQYTPSGTTYQRTVSTEDCGPCTDYYATGPDFADPAEICIAMHSCPPAPPDCCVSIPSPIGAWSVSS